ncbi:F-box/LRR-repeat protein At3g58980-like [Silene latifolia]|uniref:F-box/LRR-repeat protein At3g58980-like n=1 Tax=Silene latifolia TaxID=37657 RepID=UPI003D77DB6B
MNADHPNAPNPPSLVNLIHDIVYNGTNIKEFKVCSENFGTLIPLPCSLFKKQSLEVLEVYTPQGIFLGDVVQSHYKHPNLRKLVIRFRECDLKLFENIVKFCPLLEILRFHVEMLTKFKGSIKINAQNLSCLVVNLVSEEYSLDKSKIILDTPKLEYFEVHSPSMVKFCFLKTPSGLMKAKLFLGDGHQSIHLYSKHLMSIFNPIFRVKILKISGDLLVALSNPNVLVEVFHKLSHLEMTLSCSLSWHATKYFLGKCPNLESLVLKKTGKAKWSGTILWSEFELLPHCLHNKIQRIELRDCLCKVPELVLFRYIFGVAKNLKMFYITIEREEVDEIGKIMNVEELRKIMIVEELGQLSKKLPKCEINFCDENGQKLWST